VCVCVHVSFLLHITRRYIYVIWHRSDAASYRLGHIFHERTAILYMSPEHPAYEYSIHSGDDWGI
jgi:hypothetical protein